MLRVMSCSLVVKHDIVPSTETVYDCKLVMTDVAEIKIGYQLPLLKVGISYFATG